MAYQRGNPNGRPNCDVLRPWINASDVVRRDSGTWVIDFTGLTEPEASLYEKPFEYILQHVKPKRQRDRNRRTRENWWLFERTRRELRAAVRGLPRYIVTPVVAKHRLFDWRSAPTLPMNVLDVIASADDVISGILHSRIQELWTLRMCSWLGVGNDPRYTPTTTFETFPFRSGITPNLRPTAYSNEHSTGIGNAARKLVALRDKWLNPAEWVNSVSEVVPRYPDRLLPKDGHEADLKKRTLTRLYNERPDWLDKAHRELDQQVAAAYGWPANLSDDEILEKLLALNLGRAPA